MENVLKKDLIRLNSECIYWSKQMAEITAPYVVDVDGFQMIEFNKMPLEERMKYDLLSECCDSTSFKIDCIYELFPQLLEPGYVRITSTNQRNNEEFPVFADLAEIKTGKRYLEIAGEIIACKQTMTKSEYRLICSNKWNEMVASGKITAEMVEDSKNYSSDIKMDDYSFQGRER